jgi:hypothetical protein
MGELETLIKANTQAVERNTEFAKALTAEVKAYRDTTEKALEFHKQLIHKLISFEQRITSKWQEAAIKWGGWVVGVGIVITEIGIRLLGE